MTLLAWFAPLHKKQHPKEKRCGGLISYGLAAIADRLRGAA
jgi:hypothetical protein